jgi:hypothetical protein
VADLATHWDPLLVRGLYRLAAFVAVTVTVSAIVNALTARLLARPAGACPRRGAATGDPPVQAEEGLEPEAAPRLS